MTLVPAQSFSPWVPRPEWARLVLALARDEAACANLARLLAEATDQCERRHQELIAEESRGGTPPHRR